MGVMVIGIKRVEKCGRVCKRVEDVEKGGGVWRKVEGFVEQ